MRSTIGLPPLFIIQTVLQLFDQLGDRVQRGIRARKWRSNWRRRPISMVISVKPLLAMSMQFTYVDNRTTQVKEFSSVKSLVICSS
jgi:hypothetical protein